LSVSEKKPHKSRLKRVFHLLFLESALAMAYETWVGPTYLSGFAGEARASIAVLAFLTALPWIGQGGQLLGLFAFQGTSSVRRYVLRLAGLARGLWVFPLLLLAWEGQLTERWFLILAVSATLTALCASASAMAWLAWIKSLIPNGFHGRFFGARQRAVMAALILSNGFAGLVLRGRAEGDLSGYLILIFAALSLAFFATLALSKVPDVSFEHHEQPVAAQIREVLRTPEAVSLIALGAVFTGAVQLAGPYFPYFFTHELGISMGEVSFWTIASNLGSFLASGPWGRYLDRHPLALKRVVAICGGLIVLSPLPYIVLGADVLRVLAPFEYALNGAAWSGLNLVILSSAFRWIPAKLNAPFFSLYTVILGLMGAASAALGGWIVEHFADAGGFRLLWGVGSGVRAMVLASALLFASQTLRRGRRSRRGSEKTHFSQ
jgi:hypothetical protein